MVIMVLFYALVISVNLVRLVFFTYDKKKRCQMIKVTAYKKTKIEGIQLLHPGVNILTKIPKLPPTVEGKNPKVEAQNPKMEDKNPKIEDKNVNFSAWNLKIFTPECTSELFSQSYLFNKLL